MKHLPTPRLAKPSFSLPRLRPLRRALLNLRPRLAPELIVDEALQLQALRVEDSDPIFSLIEDNREHLLRWLPWVKNIRSRHTCRQFVRKARYRNIFAGQWVYAIWFQGEIVGLLDFNEGEPELRQVSLGYWLGEKYQRQGIVTRAVRTSLDYVFSEQHILRVLIKCAAKNVRSQRVPQRLDFSWQGIEHEVGTLHGEVVDMVVYSMSRQQWEAREL